MTFLLEIHEIESNSETFLGFKPKSEDILRVLVLNITRLRGTRATK